MYTYDILLSDYELLLKIADTGAKVDIFGTTDWIKKNDKVVTLHFADFESFDNFMMYVDMFEASSGMDEEQENLTATGIQLQKIYDGAYALDVDDE
ncbi:hypothetical protein [Lactiplantibacillus herbarum]|uniref:hypothetical protein n=1 Tax=Lactiplantibacillus herbarum TaxID=1670446 RepID=UPI00064F14A4|nr:hypothetical protein [Lactiplantibacillus herbarum]